MCKWEEQLANVQISQCANEKTVIKPMCKLANVQMANEKTVINYKTRL
jgi:hypothetical protein